MRDFPNLGHGIGLRPPHYAEIVAERPEVDWFEVITENFMVPGGNPRRVLREVRASYPVVLHGVSLSLGSVDPLDQGYLADLARLAAEIEPAFVSDHLCWSSYGGHTGHDLWPLPLTEEALAHVVRRVQAVQERLGRRILVENVSSYLEYAHSTLSEFEFLSELSRRTDCGLLLDVNNIFVSASNQGYDPQLFLAGVPADRVAQIHLAGHRDEGTHRLDTHDQPVCDEVWSLYRRAVERFGAVSTLLERDDNIPPLAEVIAESRKAAAIESEVLARVVAAPPNLAEVQAAIYDLVTAPEGVASRLLERASEGTPFNIEGMIRDGARMSAADRVDVYANMYFYRILDVLRDEFARTLAAVGDGAFHNLITDYLLDCRPAHPSLREVGARLPEYLAQHPIGRARPWLGELARLERAYLELFDGPDSEVLTLERVRQLTPDSLSDLRLCAIPCHAIHHNLHQTSAAWTGLGVSPSEPATPAALGETLLVWRQELVVYHRRVDPDEAPLLPLLRSPGSAFALICERLLLGTGTVDVGQASLRAFELLRRWITDGLLVDPTEAPRPETNDAGQALP